MRVVSLLPSATEICFALGVEPVGVSHECDYPPAARSLPAVNDVRIDTDGTSEDINTAVAEAEDDGGGVYEIDTDLLADLDPDYVITQGICEVCAVDQVLVADAVAERDLDAEILTTDPHSLGDLYDDIHRIGTALDADETAADLVADLRAREAAVRQQAAAVEDRPRVAVFDWMDPIMCAGHWVPELIDIAGGRCDLVDPGERSTPWEFETVREYDPEVAIAAPCGYGLDQTLQNRSELTDRPGWESLTAVENDRFYAMDGHHYVNRPGPRLLDTLEHLAGLLHPDRFDTPPRDMVLPVADSEADTDTDARPAGH
jgi:iron complex transport system substrate-binding protein